MLVSSQQHKKNKDTKMAAEFRVSCELVGHDSAIRAICPLDNDVLVTGAMDTSVLSWIKDTSGSDPGAYIELLSARLYEHEHWVTALLRLPPNVLGSAPNGGFITGSMDKAIRVFTLEGVLVTTLHGHEGGVISLAFTGDGKYLISGSWDGTARVWDLEQSVCRHVLSGHENGVCVLGLPDNVIVTGSTGRQVENSVVDFQLRFWTDFKLTRTVRDHTGPIRQLVLLPNIGFVSCSNDGSIRVRTVDGEMVAEMHHPLNAEGKPGFVLGVTVLPDNTIVSASEDCTARVWTPEGMLLQTIEHPGGLWCVTALPNGDFVTGCDDKTARIFTKNASCQSVTARASFEAAVQEARLVRERGPSGVEIAKLPDYDQRASVTGKSDGQIQMFRKGDKAWACQWSGPSRTWVDIGEVTGTGSGGVVDGKAYDMVIPVEIEQPGGVRSLEIGCNQGDNPFMVAQEFINKHMLDQSYLRQIADYITQRSGEYRAPVIGTDTGTPDVLTSAPASSGPKYKYFPVNAYATFETTKIAKLISTVRQFNDKVSDSVQLSVADLIWLETTANTVQQTAFYHSSTFASKELSVLTNVIKAWPVEHVFPLLDLLRLVLVHPQGGSVIGHATSESIIDTAVRLASDVSTDVPNATRMLSLRVLANMFNDKSVRDAVVAKKSLIISALPAFAAHRQKTIALSLATLVLNFARLHVENLQVLTPEEVITIGSVAMDIVIGAAALDELGEDVVVRALVTVGSLAIDAPQETTNAFAALVNVFTASKSSQLQAMATANECLDELTQCLGIV